MTARNCHCAKIIIMPIPLIIWGAIAAASALGGAVATVSANERIKRAKQKSANRYKRYKQAIRKYEEKHDYTASRLTDLGKIRLEAVVTLGKAVEFLEQAKLKERELFEKFNITQEQLVRFRKASISAREILKGGFSAISSGVATAAAAYGLVGTLASASTGTAISVLSGVAAKSATLAWLGGGTLAAGGGGVAAGTAVLGGLVVGPAILVAGLWRLKQAGDVEIRVEKHIAELDIDEKKKQRVVTALDAVLARVGEVKTSAIKLKNELASILSSSSQIHLCPLRLPILWRLGCRTCDRHAYQIAKVAQSLGQLLDIAILDEEGRII